MAQLMTEKEVSIMEKGQKAGEKSISPPEQV
jgi:hypothetical protein